MHKRAHLILVGMPRYELTEAPFPLTKYSAVHDYTDTGARPVRRQLPTLHVRDFPRRNPSGLAFALAGTLVCMLTALVMWVSL